MTTITISPESGRSASCTPLCKSPARRGTKQLPLSAINLDAQSEAPTLGLSANLAITISTRDGHAMQIDLDAPTATALHGVLSIEMSRVNEGHAPAPRASHRMAGELERVDHGRAPVDDDDTEVLRVEQASLVAGP